jgi:hypothetical protein
MHASRTSQKPSASFTADTGAVAVVSVKTKLVGAPSTTAACEERRASDTATTRRRRNAGRASGVEEEDDDEEEGVIVARPCAVEKKGMWGEEGEK